MRSLLKLLVVLSFSFVAIGCATMNTVKPLSPEIDAKVKQLTPPAEKALVYVVRPTWLGKPFGGTISANDEYIGTTQGGMYVYAVLSPGEYRFKVTGHDNQSEVVVNLDGGKIYYIYQSVYPAVWKGAAKLALVGEEKGKESLNKCKLGDMLGRHVIH